ncbi:BMP family ABC transporter substrate-binding protein [Aquibium sp. ELW1220]|jgi:basic membrane protein A|uniref:BMP family ABC transporter substrate-binding protein n=1 Tax=Aquibium sp. ELW1220 TaxID=2976766 RepID=UPI0025B018D1|nr:BMP family ABC transporter substrate-binding protein [Aquibium sp. ELW1220]MDN2579555.1 BMP family ABC transporter substrate-binding protein [Aquibium sp. ELW1220]
MIKIRDLTRRGFLNIGAAAGASLLLPKSGLISPARAAAPLPAVAEEDAVIAWGYVGPTADEGWTYAHDLGRQAVAAAFPKAKTLFVENVPYSADASRIFRQFAAEGANMIIANSNYGDFIYDVAKRTPDVAFYECDGRNPLDNLGTYYVAHWYPSYIAGVAAGLMSKSGKLGYVASFPVPSVYSGTNAFLMGARTVKPDATLQAIVINSWFDPQAAAQAGTALIDNGADVLFGIMDEAAYLQVAEQRGAKAVMWNTDIRRYGPQAYISSIVVDFSAWYVEQVRRRIAGEWTPTEDILPIGKGVDRDAWGETVPAEAAAQADAIRDKIMGGWSPFEGEIKDAKGNVKVAAGHRMTEVELYNWDWSIEGVTGL